MNVPSNKNVLTDFFTKKPLYSKLLLVNNVIDRSGALSIKSLLLDKAFAYVCPFENNTQTFITKDTEHIGAKFFESLNNIQEDSEVLPNTFNEFTRKVEIALHVDAECQSCKRRMNYLLKFTSDKSWDERDTGISIYVQKVGQYPAYDVGLNSTLKKYLNKEDQINYKRALTCLSISYGVGAYAYFRRVIENEIKRIIQDISQLDFAGALDVRKALVTFEKDHQMSKLIDVLNKHLPLSLQELGGNPIRLLYEQLSGGIHEYSDEECIEKSRSIDTIFNYVIKKVNEEKYQLGDVKSAMKSLKGS